MKIDSIPHLPAPAQVDTGKAPGKTPGMAAAGRASGGPTSLRSLDAGAAQDIDQARVAELRQAIADGRLKVDTDRIADRLIASARDLMGAAE